MLQFAFEVIGLANLCIIDGVDASLLILVSLMSLNLFSCLRIHTSVRRTNTVQPVGSTSLQYE